MKNKTRNSLPFHTVVAASKKMVVEKKVVPEGCTFGYKPKIRKFINREMEGRLLKFKLHGNSDNENFVEVGTE